MPLVAGPLRLEYSAGDLRCVRLGEEEILRRIYVVFQDRNWTARPWHIEQEVIEARDDSFDIALTARGSFDAEPFHWEAVITGSPEGTLHYAIRGEASEPFLRNRLGICVLHPMAGFAGRECVIGHPDGSQTPAAFPDRISPHQPFLDVITMTYPVAGGEARIDFTGEVFETEDHRNWSDASYKTYCTPIALPFPVEVRPGDVVSQAVSLTLSGAPEAAPAPPPVDQPVRIVVSAGAQPLPRIGVHLTDPEWSEAERADLMALGLSHLHVDIDASAPDATQRIGDAVARARQIEAALFIALHVEGAPDALLAAALADAGDTLAGIWIIHPEEKVTARSTLDSWRSRLGPDLPWGCGTNLYFTELNRQPPDATGLAWTTFSVNPQVHAQDDRSVLQNTATLAVIAGNAPRLAGGSRLHAGPITLRPRFNPNATDPEADVSNTDLPADVDARQRTWFAAAWVALALRSLTSPGTISAVTFFDDLGWRGLRARDAGPEDAAFDSIAGERFPVYDVVASLTGFDHMLPTSSREPEAVDALVVEGQHGRRAIIANLTDSPREAHLTGAVEAAVTLAPHTVRIIDLPGRTP